MKIKNIVIKCIAGFILLASCAPSKEAGGHMVVPEQFSSDKADSSTVSAIPWKDFFRDEELVQYISQAVEQNFDVLSALKSVELAEQELRQARIDWLPEISFSPGGSHTRYTDMERNGGLAGDANSYSLPLQFSWEIDVWGKIRKAKQAARSEYLRTTEVRHAVLSSVVANVATTYYDVLLLNKQVEIVERSIALNDTILAMLNVQYKLGDVPLPIVRQAEAQHRSNALTRLQMMSELSLRQNALALLTGKTVIDKTIVRSGFTEQMYRDSLAVGIPAYLLQNRPDVKASEFALQSANARVGIARRNFYPALTLQAQGGLRDSSIGDLFSVDKTLFGIIDGALYQPLFKRGKLKKEYAQAKIVKEQSEIEFRKSFTTAYIEVSDALAQTGNLKEQYVQIQDRSRLLSDALRDSQLLFRSGRLSYIEVLTVQRDLLQSQLEEAAIACRKLQSEAELYRALGGGWK